MGSALQDPMLDERTTPGFMKCLIKAVNANARRYLNPESSLNVGLPVDCRYALLERCMSVMWEIAGETPLGGIPSLNACLKCKGPPKPFAFQQPKWGLHFDPKSFNMFIWRLQNLEVGLHKLINKF